MIIEICVGSSCHIKGSYALVELFKKEVEDRNLDAEVTLAGCFCTGRCNRVGVTVIIDDVPYTGVTPEKFPEFFKDIVLKKLKEGK